MAEGVFELPTLGRPMQLGMLYDCRNDSLIPGLTLWDPAILQNYRDIRPQPGTQFDIISSDGVDDKASALNVDASLKASFLSGLVEVQGSAKFLSDSKASQHQSRLTLHYRTTTTFEQLTMKQLGRHNVQHPEVFDQGTATHVITGILYGAQAFFVFDRDCSKEENLKDVHEHLHGVVKRVVSAEMDGGGSLKLSERENVNKIRCKFHGDFKLEKNPSNYDEAVSIYKKLPSLLGSNGENAVPMRVWLYPLDRLDHKAAKLVRQISVNLISQSQGILKGLEKLQVKCNDLIKAEICTDFPQFPEKLSQLKKLLLEYKVSFQQYLARALPDIRGGGLKEEALAKAIRGSLQSPFSLQQLNSWVASKEKEMNVIKAYMKIFTGIQVIKSRAEFDELVLDPSVEHVICFSFPLTGHEGYLIALSQHLKSPDSQPDSPAVGWFDDASVAKNIRSRARNFAEFYRANKQDGEVAFAVTGFDDPEALGQEGGTIHLYEAGILATTAFEPPGKPGKPSITRKTHNQVSLEWQAPKCGLSEVMYYRVKYRGMKPGSHSYISSDWTEARTTSEERNIIVQDLQPFTSYEFYVAAVCRAGVSIDSEGSDICTTLPANAPAGVRKHAVSDSSMTIVWDQPDLLGEGVVIEHYLIKYKQIVAPSVAKPIDEATKFTDDQSCLFTIDDVQAGERYSVWVSAVCGSAGIGTESEMIEIDSDPEPVKYAKAITLDAEILAGGCESKGEPTIFKIPLISEPVASGGKYRSYSFGEKSRVTQNHKVIMIVGATGAGKSTLINGMINYIVRVDWKDGFRFKIVDEKGERASKSQAHSQTQIITSYTLHRNKQHKIPYTLTIVDTPGFGDTRGIERDKAIIDQIRDFFSHSDVHQVDHIDAIGFVAQSSQARLTPTQQYVFDHILSIFGKDISSNILLLITFCDGQRPPVLNAVQEANIPCSDSMFKFNNSALFASNKTASKGSSADDKFDGGSNDEGDAESFDKMFWRMGEKSMWNFFNALDTLQSKSLSLTKEVLKERKRLETAVEGLQPQIQMGLCQLEKLRKEQQILKQHEAKIQANKDFTFEVEVPKSRMINITDYITNCSKCHFTCHHPCGIADDKEKHRCWAMDGSGHCFVCPGKCIWNIHFNQKYKFEYYSVKEKRTFAEVEERYKNAKGEKLSVEQVIQKHFEEFLSVRKCVFVLITNSHESLKRLEEIALKPNPLSTVEYVDLLMESERTEAKPGWQSRIKVLQDIRKQADIMRKVKQANFDPFENYKKEILDTETGKPNSPWYKFW